MSVEAVGIIASEAELNSVAGHNAQQSQSDFAVWMDAQLGELNSSILNSDKLVRELAAGDNSNLHHVMLELEKTKMSFQLALQVRNRLLEGYQEIMRMQI